MKLFVLIIVVCLLFAIVAALSADEVRPIAMCNRAIGGAALNAYTPGVENGMGANNIGLLIKTWGKVTWLDTDNGFFYIDDGSRLEDGSKHTDAGQQVGNIGVRVSYTNLAPDVTINPPSKGDYVAVTCISSTVIINSMIRPNLRLRRQSDIQ